MDDRFKYKETEKQYYKDKTDKIVENLPIYISIYFDAKSDKMSYKTLLGYAYDMQKFLEWVRYDMFGYCDHISDISITEFSTIMAHDIERYILFLQSDEKNINSGVSIRRKISSLSSIYNFLVNHLYLDENPCKEVEYPDIVVPDTEVLTNDNITEIFNQIINAEDIYSDRQNTYIQKTNLRDFTIMTLLLTTGIRVNECVSLDVGSVLIDKKLLRVNRGSDIFLPLSDRTLEVLKKYKESRTKISAGTSALFLSMQNKRLCTQAIEDMIRKYSKTLKRKKPVTPKTFRHTFAAALYKETANSDLINSYLGKRKVEEIRILMNHLSPENKEMIYDSLNKMYTIFNTTELLDKIQ